MQQGLLPLFPLPVVLFPRTQLPLHLFEDRYKEMIANILTDHSEFGVVLAKERSIVKTGCTAVIEKVLQRYPDGRLNILTAGRRRFEIQDVDDQESYLRATVEYFDDEESGAPPSLEQQGLEAYRRLREIDDSLPELRLGDPQISFQLAQGVEDVEFRLRLLRLRSEPERLKALVEFCESYVPKQRVIAGLKRVQPLNGHSTGRLPN